MEFQLAPVEVRILGSLIEKEIATPEYYPLTLNALVNACNQKSNREPLVEYDDETVEDALDGLRKKGLAAMLSGAGMRVPKHRQLLSEALNLGRRELALLCVLMLRGPQTAGELHSRTERLHHFADLEEVESCAQKLMEWQPGPLVVRLPVQPGRKEPRYVQLLSGEVPVEAAAEPVRPREDRFSALEAEIGALRRDVEQLRQQFAEFRRQFE